MTGQGADPDQKKDFIMDDSTLVSAFTDLPAYGPPLHSGTVNRRLVAGALGAGFEVVHGIIQPGGMGHRHHHATEWQVILLMAGEGRLQLGDAPPVTIRARTVVRIPPGMPHLFEVTGQEPAEVIVALLSGAWRAWLHRIMSETTARLPLDGYHVLDLTAIVLGPLATLCLADMGANVIKVEPPEGDGIRGAGTSRTPRNGVDLSRPEPQQEVDCAGFFPDGKRSRSFSAWSGAWMSLSTTCDRTPRAGSGSITKP